MLAFGLATGSGHDYGYATMSEIKSDCGPHIDLVKTDNVRISRCPCGTLHMNLVRNSITVQLAPEHFAEVVQALSLAKTVLAGAQEPAPALNPTTPTGGFVTISVLGAKKPAN